MKVIGTAAKGALLVEMQELELCRILGFSSLYDSAYKAALEKACPKQYGEALSWVGIELSVNNLAEKVGAIRNREADAKRAAETLTSLAEALAAAWPELTISPKEKAA